MGGEFVFAGIKIDFAGLFAESRQNADWQKELAELDQKLAIDDELGKFLRIQLEYERLLWELISLKCDADILKQMKEHNISGHALILVAHAAGLPQATCRLLLFLNKKRNRFAHRVGTTIEPSWVDAFQNEFPSPHRDLMGNVREALGLSGRDEKFNSLILVLWLMIRSFVSGQRAQINSDAGFGAT
jgi:hypothetical protein